MKFTTVLDLPEPMVRWLRSHPGTEADAIQRYLEREFDREQRLLQRRELLSDEVDNG